MAIVKQVESKELHTLVTFKIGNYETLNSSQVLLLGDFNDWQINESSSEMKKDGDSFIKSLKLKNGKKYEFRYLSNDTGWFNDSEADDYVPSPYAGIHNSVVDLSSIPSKTQKKDDLKKIEGIGPKIASILSENGLETFEKLSKATVATLEGILKEAGNRYTRHKPHTWPEQSKLAFDGKWKELKEWQKTLKGGK